MPCLITALSELNEPRYMTPGGIFDAYKKDITVWGRKDLQLSLIHIYLTQKRFGDIISYT